MALLDHRLSEETIKLIERAVDAIGGRLAIYTRHNWAVERLTGGQLAFDPNNDSTFLRDQLSRIIDRGF
jgi:hypothetical protein